jgi:hypothetical protein
MVAVLLGSQCVLEHLAVLADVPPLSVGEEILNVTVETAVRADRRAETCPPIVCALGTLVAEHAL